MAHMTKAQRREEEALLQLKVNEEFEANRYQEFMEIVALMFRYNKACLMGGWGEPSVFTVEQVDDPNGTFFIGVLEAPSSYSREMHQFNWAFTSYAARDDFIFFLDRLRSEISYMESYAEEEQRKRMVRSSALAKLNKEERELLGV